MQLVGDGFIQLHARLGDKVHVAQLRKSEHGIVDELHISRKFAAGRGGESNKRISGMAQQSNLAPIGRRRASSLHRQEKTVLLGILGRTVILQPDLFVNDDLYALALGFTKALFEILFGPERRAGPLARQYQCHFVAPCLSLHIEKSRQTPGCVDLVFLEHRRLDPRFQVDTAQSQRIQASTRKRRAMPAGRAVSMVELQFHAPVFLARCELIQQRPGQRHIYKVGARIHFVAFVKKRQLLEIHNRLVGSHPHRHAHHQRALKNLRKRKLRAPRDIGENVFELRRIGGIQYVAARAALQQSHGIVHVLVFGRSAHPGPDQESQRGPVNLPDSLPNLIEFFRDSAGPFSMMRGLPG